MRVLVMRFDLFSSLTSPSFFPFLFIYFSSPFQLYMLPTPSNLAGTTFAAAASAIYLKHVCYWFLFSLPHMFLIFFFFFSKECYSRWSDCSPQRIRWAVEEKNYPQSSSFFLT